MLNYFYIVVLPATERSFSLCAALPNEAEGAAVIVNIYKNINNRERTAWDRTGAMCTWQDSNQCGGSRMF